MKAVANKKAILKLTVIYSVTIFAAYWIWVYFVYLIVPYKEASYVVKLKRWPQNGYFKVRPGRYENKKYGTYFTINSKGFRADEFEEDKGKAFRIIVLGESSTMGLESNDEETWPKRLQEYLSRYGASVEVINCGIGSTTSFNHLQMLKNEIIGYKPDLILYYAGRNDLAAASWERYPGPSLYKGGRWNFFKHWGVYKKIQLRFILLKLFGYDIEPIIPWPNQWIPVYKANLEVMVQEAKKAGIVFVIITQIMDYPPELFEAMTEGFAKDGVIKKISMRTKGWHMYLRQIDILRAQAELTHKYDIIMLDLHKEFYISRKSGLTTHYDCIHLTPDGNDLIGKTLTFQIKQHFALPEIESEERI